MSLNIVVCVKSVINAMWSGKWTRTKENIALNPFDRPPIEMARSLVNEHGGEVTLLSMGPESASYAIYQAMAMGADKAILVCDRALKGSDTYVTATVLGSALKRMADVDIVLFGTRSSDSDTGHVGPQTAEMLRWPLVTNIFELSMTEKNFFVENKADGYIEQYEGTCPAVFTVNPAFMESGYTALHEIENTFREKTLDVWDLKKIGLNASQTGTQASPTKIISLNKEKKHKKCHFIEGSMEEKAEKLMEQLKKSGVVV